MASRLSWAEFVLILWLLLLIRCLHSEKILCPSSCSCLGHLVDCSRRGLIEIPPDLPEWMEILELQHNDITHLSEDVFKDLVNLQQLDISYNQLRSLDAATFSHLPNLREINVQHNHLSEIPNLGYLPNLTVLLLQHNEIHTISMKRLADLPFLKTLDLNHNRIVEINVGSFPENSRLLHLSLSNNRIVNLEPGCLDNLTNLESLRLNKNQLTVLPKPIFRKLRSLKILEINRNKLVALEGLTFQELESLQILRLRHNDVSSLSDGTFWGLNSIQQLKLDNNNITVITKGWLYGLASLQQLSLRHNRISEIEENGWEFCQDLWELDLAYNKLHEIRKGTFAKLGKLRRLLLNHNRISYLEDGTFKGLNKLENLDLNKNEISWAIEDMNGAFVGLDHLTQLHLESNTITSIAKKAFQGLDLLKHLDLGDNAITSIQNNAFQGMRHLQHLHFNSSHFVCDCNLLWLSEWLLESGFQASIIAHCAYPSWLMGKSIFELNPEDYTCDDFPKPYIIEEPNTQVSLKGANVTLNCQAESSSKSQMTFQWKKDNINIKNAHVETHATVVNSVSGEITRYKSTIMLWNISDKDEGRYQCIVTNNFGSMYSAKAKITVHVYPVFLKTPSDVTVKAGNTARLECAARGQPVPVIAWQKDGGDDFPAARERRMHVMPSDDVFFIVNVNTSDMGIYSCTAQNAAGLIIANASLTVLETPSFIKAIEDKKTRIGETTVMECMAKGSPKPKLTWMKDGLVISRTERHYFTVDSQLLVIVDTQRSDGGTYTCEMSNTLGTERGSAFLKVLPVVSSGSDDDSTTTGIIIIAVVCCVVGTSLVWVIIIYQTRKRSEEFASMANSCGGQGISEIAPYPAFPPTSTSAFDESTAHIYVDNNSEHSKDSGTGESSDLSGVGLLAGRQNGILIEGSKLFSASIDADTTNSHDPPSDCSLETLTSTSSTQTTSSGEAFPARPTNHERLLQTNSNQASSRSQEADPTTKWTAVARSQSVDLPSESTSPEGDQLDNCRQLGFATFPRNVSPSFQGGWSTGSLRHLQLPRDVQNDSGSFSIASDELQPLQVSNTRITVGDHCPVTAIPHKSPFQRHNYVVPQW